MKNDRQNNNTDTIMCWDGDFTRWDIDELPVLERLGIFESIANYIGCENEGDVEPKTLVLTAYPTLRGVSYKEYADYMCKVVARNPKAKKSEYWPYLEQLKTALSHQIQTRTTIPVLICLCITKCIVF